MNSEPMIPEEVARRAVEECATLLARRGEEFAPQEAVSDLIDLLRDNATTIIAKAVGLG